MKPTKEQIEQYRKIVADAPDGATHWDGTYYRYEGYEYGQAYLVLKNCSWTRGTPSYPYLYVVSLDNLRTIITLWDENQALKNDNQVLSSRINKAWEILDAEMMTVPMMQFKTLECR